MAPVRLPRNPLRVLFILGYLITIPLIRLPFWLVYYSWRPNRPRKSWTLHRTINAQILRRFTKLSMKMGLVDGRDPLLEVPQEELEPLNARFVWIPELGEEYIVGVIAAHADQARVKSIAVPAYWMLKEGTKWSPEYDKAGEGEKVILYFHGGGFVVRFFPPFLPFPGTNSHLRLGLHTLLTRRHRFPRDHSSIPRLYPEYCRSSTD
jgi:hypothetical protein